MREVKEINRLIGSNVRKYRKLRSLTQEQLAEQLGLTSKFIALVEQGQAGVSLETLKALCTVLRVESDAIIFENVDSSEFKSIVSILEEIKDVDRKHLKNIENILIEYLKGIRY